MVQRSFFIGSEWIFLKIYSGPRTIENILVEMSKKLNDMVREHLIDSYFFIRYSDPDYHIRLRLHCPDIAHYGTVLQTINKALKGYLDNMVIQKVVVDTYKREIERYGEKNMLQLEDFFHYDSRFILKYLKKTHQNEAEKWKIPFCFIDELLEANHYSIDEKIEFTEQCSKAYYREFYGEGEYAQRFLNLRFRNYRKEIECVLERSGNVQWWQKDIQKMVSDVQLNKYSKQTFIQLSSLIHMHINRLFRTKQRFVEFIIYYYIEKYYRSKKAREQKNKISS